MTSRVAVLRSLAALDVEGALAHLKAESGASVAIAFIDAFEAAVNQICRTPNTGTLRFAYDLGIPDLRAQPLRRFPYLVFYVAHDSHVDIWRVLHTRRDIPGAFGSGE